MTTLKNPVKFYYIGNRQNPSETGIMTVATEVVNDDVHLGFAFCSPKDKFCKKVGRIKAFGRMKSESDRIVLKFTGHSSDAIAWAFNSVIPHRPRIWHKRRVWVAEDGIIQFEDIEKIYEA